MNDPKKLDADERTKIVQTPSEAEALRPPGPVSVILGPFSGENAATRSFAQHVVPRDPEGLRKLVREQDVTLVIDDLKDPQTGRPVEINTTLAGLTSEWPDCLCHTVEPLRERVWRIARLKALKRDARRSKELRGEFLSWYRGELLKAAAPVPITNHSNS